MSWAASAAQNRLAEVLDQSRFSGEPISVTPRGRRVAVVIAPEAFDPLVDIADDVADRRELAVARAEDDCVPREEVNAKLGPG